MEVCMLSPLCHLSWKRCSSMMQLGCCSLLQCAGIIPSSIDLHIRMPPKCLTVMVALSSGASGTAGQTANYSPFCMDITCCTSVNSLRLPPQPPCAQRRLGLSLDLGLAAGRKVFPTLRLTPPPCRRPRPMGAITSSLAVADVAYSTSSRARKSRATAALGLMTG